MFSSPNDLVIHRVRKRENVIRKYSPEALKQCYNELAPQRINSRLQLMLHF